jgi:hypothetical protein
VKAGSSAELKRLLAAEFDRQGWEYDLTIGARLVDQIKSDGGVDGKRLAQSLPAEFFDRNRTNRDLVGLAIERAIGGFSIEDQLAAAVTINISDNRYQVNLGPDAQITGSNLNVGDGLQINVDVNSNKDEVLTAVEAILRAGLAGGWNDDAARDLAALIDERDDVDFEDVRRVTIEVVRAEGPKRHRVKTLLGQIATGGLGGALGTGMSTGLGELISQLPI